MRKFSNQQVFRAMLMAGGASVLAVATPALAQDAAPEDEQAGDRIVVTGSRILRNDFEAATPTVTVSRDLIENTGSAALETVLNRLPQFVPSQVPTDGGDIQPTATNTPGAATVSLRGIGANRNLVLINSRRATPGNASGVVDINTIPSSAIERVEVISGGASATYGADAVAGVTNFILKRDFVGLELDSQAMITQEGDGFEYQIGGIMGADFDDGRGNVSLAMSTNKREANFQRDRDFYRDLWSDPSIGGTQFFIETPGINFGFGNLPDFTLAFPNANPAIPAAGTTVFSNTDGSPFTTTFGARGGVPNFNGATDGLPFLLSDAGTLSENNTNLFNILPLVRYNFLAQGNYEVNDWIGVFGEVMFSQVKTRSTQEPGPITAGWSVLIDPTVLDPGQLPTAFETLLASRADPDAPFDLRWLLPFPRSGEADVTTYNMTAGLEGSIPDTDWTWEAFVSHGVSSTFSVQKGIPSLERLRAVMQAPNFGAGFRAQGNAGPPDFGFGASTATCTSGINPFAIQAGAEISADCLEAVSADLKNRSSMRQTIAEANVQGSLFELPAGDVGAAFGVSYRELDFEFVNDTLTTQGRSFNDQALGIFPSGNSEGFIDVSEIYGELLIPVLSDIPFIQQLNLELGGRYSDYSTTGGSWTYKILGDWELNDFVRIRGGYNRAERAPNIGELFLAPQQTFGVNGVGDLCSSSNPLPFSANPNNANGNNVRAVCEVLMNQTGDLAAAPFFYQQDVNGVFLNGASATGTFGFAFPTLRGNDTLRPEEADTWTAGVVLSSPFSSELLSNMRLSVDWFNIKVDDAIGSQTIAVALRQCLDPSLNPLVLTDPTAAASTAFCQNVPRNPVTGALGNVTTTFVNNGRFEVEGIDANLSWRAPVGPGTVGLNVLFNYLIDFKSAELVTDPLAEFVGTLGVGQNGLNPGPFEYRVLTDLNYSIGAFTLGMQWQHLPSIEDGTEGQFGPTPTTGFSSYNIFHLNSSFTINDAVTVRFGVDNLFNKDPEIGLRNLANNNPSVTGQLPGGSFNTDFYDTNGRRFYVGANLEF